MAITFVQLNTQDTAAALQQATEKLDSADCELVLDFSSVSRIDSNNVLALQDLADKADKKAVKLALADVNVDVYKVLKLVKLVDRFSFPARRANE
jgi:anti-anti-sigma regulatory factor